MSAPHAGDDEDGPFLFAVTLNRDIGDPRTGAKRLEVGRAYKARVVLEGEGMGRFEVMTHEHDGPVHVLAVSPDEVLRIVSVDVPREDEP